MQKRAKSSINFRPTRTWDRTTRHDIVGSGKAKKRTRINPSSFITYSGQNPTRVVTMTKAIFILFLSRKHFYIQVKNIDKV